MNPIKLLPVLAAALAATPAGAQPSAFRHGPVIERYGPAAPVETDWPIPAGTEFKIAFDIAHGASSGDLNRNIESAARLVNMLAQAGVAPERVSPAIVIHGEAVKDVTRAGAGPNADLVAALIARGATFYVCGQSAASQGVTRDALLPGVKMALSAMTAHARLQQQGYTLNPF